MRRFPPVARYGIPCAMPVRIEGGKFGFSQFNPSNKKSMRWTGPACGIDRAARHTRGFRRFDADLGGECGHLLINK